MYGSYYDRVSISLKKIYDALTLKAPIKTAADIHEYFFIVFHFFVRRFKG